MTTETMDKAYSKREIDHIFADLKEKWEVTDKKIDQVIVQTTLHNGRMKKFERILLIVGCVSGTLLVANGSEFVSFIMNII